MVNLFRTLSYVKGAICNLVISILLVSFNWTVIAEEAEVEKDSPWLLTPTISSDPKLGSSVGFLGAYLKKFDEESPASMFGIMGSYLVRYWSRRNIIDLIRGPWSSELRGR